MKLILTDEVPGLGSAGDVVEVKDGYGRNFLLPRGHAVQWTKGGEKQVAQIKRARGAREIRDAQHATEVRSQLTGLSVVVAERAGEGGRLFGSVSTADIVAAIAAAGGPSLDKSVVSLPSPIKEVGKHSAKVALHSDVVVDLTFEVVPA
jgi:large subunit ribosomal protein L9